MQSYNKSTDLLHKRAIIVVSFYSLHLVLSLFVSFVRLFLSKGVANPKISCIFASALAT